MKTTRWIAPLTLIISLFFAACGSEVYSVRTRPANPVFVRPAVPRAGYVWVGDGYRWNGGRYIYQQGYWSTPRPGHTYVPGYWSRSRRGDIWVQGRWR